MVAGVTTPEAARHHLYTRVSEVLDQASADTLMQGLVFRDDLATKDDLALLRSDMNTLRSDMNILRTELKGDINTLRTELKGDINTLRAEFKGEITQAVSELNRSMRNWMGSVLVAVVAAMIGSQLIG